MDTAKTKRMVFRLRLRCQGCRRGKRIFSSWFIGLGAVLNRGHWDQTNKTGYFVQRPLIFYEKYYIITLGRVNTNTQGFNDEGQNNKAGKKNV